MNRNIVKTLILISIAMEITNENTTTTTNAYPAFSPGYLFGIRQIATVFLSYADQMTQYNCTRVSKLMYTIAPHLRRTIARHCSHITTQCIGRGHIWCIGITARVKTTVDRRSFLAGPIILAAALSIDNDVMRRSILAVRTVSPDELNFVLEIALFNRNTALITNAAALAKDRGIVIPKIPLLAAAYCWAHWPFASDKHSNIEVIKYLHRTAAGCEKCPVSASILEEFHEKKMADKIINVYRDITCYTLATAAAIVKTVHDTSLVLSHVLSNDTTHKSFETFLGVLNASGEAAKFLKDNHRLHIPHIERYISLIIARRMWDDRTIERLYRRNARSSDLANDKSHDQLIVGAPMKQLTYVPLAEPTIINIILGISIPKVVTDDDIKAITDNAPHHHTLQLRDVSRNYALQLRDAATYAIYGCDLYAIRTIITNNIKNEPVLCEMLDAATKFNSIGTVRAILIMVCRRAPMNADLSQYSSRAVFINHNSVGYIIAAIYKEFFGKAAIVDATYKFAIVPKNTPTTICRTMFAQRIAALKQLGADNWTRAIAYGLSEMDRKSIVRALFAALDENGIDICPAEIFRSVYIGNCCSPAIEEAMRALLARVTIGGTTSIDATNTITMTDIETKVAEICSNKKIGILRAFAGKVPDVVCRVCSKRVAEHENRKRKMIKNESADDVMPELIRDDDESNKKHKLSKDEIDA